jgi:sRNA-binding protein
MEGKIEAAEKPDDLPSPPGRDPATVDRKAEHTRGHRTSREHIPALRERWPAAFPKDDRKVRPLVNVVDPVAEAMGWTGSFAHGVIKGWKLRAAYCRAVMQHKERVNLDGSSSGQMVDDEARALAASRLAAIKVWGARRDAATAAKLAESASPAKVIPVPSPEPEPPPPPVEVIVLETPEQIRAHLRASLLKRRA